MTAPNRVSTPDDSYDYLIIGGGMVADNAAKAIQETDPNGTVGIISDDGDEPVTRPALTKKLWTDPDFTLDQVWLKTVEQTGAQLITGRRVDAIDPAGHRVTSEGDRVGYRRLLLATGAEPNTLELPAGERVIYFRSFDDYRRLRRLAGSGRRIAVVGGGYIGTELAAALAQNQTQVIMIYPQDLIYADKFPEPLAHRLTDLYAQHDIELWPGTKIIGGSCVDDHVRLTTDSGVTLEVDAVVVGLGVSPRTELAAEAGLVVDDGVVVDEYLVTSDPDILAAGDVASYPDKLLGRQRVEHVDNANAMGSQAGRNLTGVNEPYDYTPYFYSELFGNRYEAVGSLDASRDLVESWTADHEHGVVGYPDDHGVLSGVLLWNIGDRVDAGRAAIRKSQAGRLAPGDLGSAIGI
ncbi:MAG: FAD-dependent oxidoreductase [Microlunatus sp.]|nr:FAD-dependent oxidoreductase [Microlunatus sp.]